MVSAGRLHSNHVVSPSSSCVSMLNQPPTLESYHIIVHLPLGWPPLQIDHSSPIFNIISPLELVKNNGLHSKHETNPF